MLGLALSLTFTFFLARKSASAWIAACTEWSTSALRSLSTTPTLKSRSFFFFERGRVSVQPRASMTSGPAITSMAISRSSAPRASGPHTLMSACETRPFSAWPRGETTPQVGLWPHTPL
jgi:hypothetical protein